MKTKISARDLAPRASTWTAVEDARIDALVLAILAEARRRERAAPLAVGPRRWDDADRDRVVAGVAFVALVLLALGLALVALLRVP